MAYKSVEELNSMGTDGVAREKLILEEKKIKKSLEELDKTKNVEIMYEEMKLALLLPVQKFEKATINKVYYDSRRLINQ